jgi:hypothetical protein
MSVCIKPNLFNIDKMFLSDEKEYSIEKEDNKYNFKKINILYKYDFNICKSLQILTNYIDVLKCFTKYDKIKIIVSDPNIINIYNFIQNKINNQFNIKKIIINSDTPENKQIETDEIWMCNKKNIALEFINNVSELTLHPSKKSNLSQYNLTKIENSNEIKRYFPCINKEYNREDNSDDNNDNNFKNMHSGKFLLKFEIINYKLKCIIINGELKYTKSHIQSELKATNVYKSNIMIEL